jgi:hypothetical protein
MKGMRELARKKLTDDVSIEELKELSKEFSNKQLAELLGVHYQTILKWLGKQDKRTISHKLPTAEPMKVALQTTVSEFQYGPYSVEVYHTLEKIKLPSQDLEYGEFLEYIKFILAIGERIL